MIPDFPITDTHVHLWNPAKLRYGWLRDTLNRPYELAEFAAARGRVSVGAIVFVEAGAHSGDSLREAQWIAALASQEPRLQAIVAHAAVEKDDAAAHLDALAKLPLVRGVRRILQSEGDVRYCLRPEFVSGVKRLARYDFSFDICIKHTQLAAAVELVRACPEVTFILDHIAKPDIKAGLLEPWREDMKRMAELPNVWCKMSGLVTEADLTHWTASDLRPYVEHVLTCFGPKRTMYGSDWPVSTRASDYPRWVETLASLVSALSAEEKRALFTKTAQEAYRLMPPNPQ
jgi:L-fuconolactonase